MDYTRELNLDINAVGDLPVVRVKQGDGYSRFIKVYLFKDGEEYTPESGITYLFRCQKPDGHGVILDSTFVDEDLGRSFVILNDDNSISIETVPQVATSAGRCRCDLCLVLSGHTLSTIPFVIDVIASPNVAHLAVSTDDFRTLVSAIEQVQELMVGVAQSIGSLSIGTSWTGSESPYSQSITISGYTVTANTRVDLAADANTIATLTEQGVKSLFVVNDNGALTLYAVGEKPTSSITVQAAVYETVAI